MVEKSKQGAVDVVKCRGPLNVDTTPELATTLAALMRRGQPRAVLDLRKVTLLDSAALELLQEMRAGFQWRGGCLKLAAPGSLCDEILNVSGVGDQFETFAEVGQAVGSIT